ncbi:hypothetical protein GF366_02285, partial [Candidatus Peregrinibacteria bacterium]|nr:hypothetical protein [Candidatus Peregrinibacteria bacterium]
MEFFKKTAIGILGGVFLIMLCIIGALNLENLTKTKALTINHKSVISINSRKTAYEPMLIAPYKEMDIFISEEETPGFNFTSVGGTWEEITPEGTNVEAEVRFKVEDKWTEWLALEEEEDLVEGKKYALASSNPADSMQYKFFMYGDEVSTPKVNNVEWTFIKSGKEIIVDEPPKPQYSSFSNSSNTYTTLTSNNLGTIKRSGWGADEAYRYLENNDSDPVLINISNETYEKFKDELTYSRVVEKDENGKEYKWSLQYPEKVKKFIIHHTASTKNLDDPSQAIRDIYYYHSVTKGWGDIGYNYIIDRNGKIYEGRYGGEGVIGAHAGIANNGSIGIAVLGSYENEKVPQNVISAISKLISQKSKIHNIDPQAYSLFRGQMLPNVIGHKDVMNTTCPGAYLYEKLPVIRSLSANSFTYEKEKFVKDFDYQDRSEVYYLELRPGETVEVTIKLENIGKKSWDSNTFIVVDSNPEFENLISFPGSDPVKLAMIEGNNVEPGETGTFRFNIKGGKKSGIINMNIAPLMNGTNKSRDYIVVPVAVQQTDFKYEFIDSKYPPKSMGGGQEFTGWVKLKNTGNITWNRTGENTVLLGTDHEQDRNSKFISPHSPSNTRIGYLEEDHVKPGEIGTFSINLKAPDQPGYYKEYFTPVVEGVTWMSDTGMYFETTVYGDLYASSVEKVEASSEWQQGKKYLIRIKLRNLGQKSWTKNNLKVVFLKETDLEITDTQLLSDEVKPGETGIITFIAKTADNEELERKPLLVRPMINGSHLLERPIYVYYKVIENKQLKDLKQLQKKWSTQTKSINLTSENEENIRVKLSFSGNPQITANGSYEIYSGTDHLATLSAGEIAEVKLENQKYQVETPKGTFEKDYPIRFIPKNAAILKINNYEKYSSWDSSYKDNQFRGNLEIHNINGDPVAINELPLEEYLKGLAEVPNSEEYEKIKAIIVAARSYAKYYMD